MRRYIILYIAVTGVTLASFFIMLRTISAEAEPWQIITGATGFLLTLTMALFFFIKLRKMKDG